mmetsp:Transcript_36150/g.79150  ORF Transcript_36150/g.79150 Transcript_36150/m.79150 type:complete len:397 (+) Transcript_36150:157-1347(+)
MKRQWAALANDSTSCFVAWLSVVLAAAAASLLIFIPYNNRSHAQHSSFLQFYGRRALQASPYIQKRPVQVNSEIVVVGSTFESVDSETLRISIPEGTRSGDLLVLFVGGSGGSHRRPGEPSGGWYKFMNIGQNDLNLSTYHKLYNEKDDASTFTIEDGKKTFAVLSSLRGVDRNFPLVDYGAKIETMPGGDGAALAPSVFGNEKGVVLVIFIYDDPHVVRVMDNAFEMLVSTATVKGDGMASAIAATTVTGYVGPVLAYGSWQKGAGNDIAAAISFRAEGGPYIDPPEILVPTAAPTQSALWWLDDVRDEANGDWDITITRTGIPTAQPTLSPTSPLVATANPTSRPSVGPTLAPTSEWDKVIILSPTSNAWSASPSLPQLTFLAITAAVLHVVLK